MFTIEEARASRPASQLNIPMGAKYECGEEAVKQAVEEIARAEEIGFDQNVRKTISAAWKKLTAGELPGTSNEQKAT